MSATLDPVQLAKARIEARKAVTERQGRRTAYVTRYRDDFPAFLRDIVTWDQRNLGPTPYQEELAHALMRNPRLAFIGPHGLGKTFLCALAMWWFITTRDGVEDWKLPVTAGAWRQLTHFLWPEFRNKWVRRLAWDRIGIPPPDPRTELLKLRYRGKSGEAYAVAATNPELIEGAHADSLLYIFDEAKAIPDENFDAAEGAFSSAGAGGREALSITGSTPGDASGRLYEIVTFGTRITGWDGQHFTLQTQAGEKGAAYAEWWTRTVSWEETVAANRNSAAWGAARAKQWGVTSAIYINRVQGLFVKNRADGVIPLSWIEAAQARWHERGTLTPNPHFTLGDDPNHEMRVTPPGPLTALGVDVGGGVDSGVLARRYDQWIAPLAYEDDVDTTSLASAAFSIIGGAAAPAIVDAIGIGAGVVSELRKLGAPVIPFIASERVDTTDATGIMTFRNRRAHAWWLLRQQLDPASGSTLALPPDDRLAADLSAPNWWLTTDGKLQIESKDDLRKRLGRSTDAGDAVVMACYDGRDAVGIPDLTGVQVITIARRSPWDVS